ncbi:MAG TPA: zf-HC2 domain-containing protein [Candidatus Polarisedimenticolia bacterium]|jgi:hypothetical protein|nr:zf-HC2 domain-containing protein [Candidatus Polarisedimenticolia bacterium]
MRQKGCPDGEPLLSSFAAGALEEVAERRVRDHLASCAACRDAVLARDPTVLFLGLRREPLPGDFWTGFNARLRVRLEAEGRPRASWIAWASDPGFRRLAYVAAPLAMVLLIGTLFLVRPGGPGTVAERAPAPPFGLQELSGSAGQDGPPALEEVGSPSARVYRFPVAPGGNETPIYFVVDESIDI